MHLLIINNAFKISVMFFILFLHLTNCLNLSADNVKCILFKSPTKYRVIRASEPEEILIQDIFNASLKTVFLSPGSPTETIDALPLFCMPYIKTKRYNVVYFDSCKYTCEKHTCDWQIPGLFGEVMQWFGNLYGSVISKLIQSGLPVHSIELVGHSWGAGVAFFTAKNTIHKLPLLIGLDPNNKYYSFHKGIADYTIALHSNMGQYGQMNMNSDTDLVANDGSIQPNCTNRNIFSMSYDEIDEVATCSHRIALNYWMSMLGNPNLFFGVECNKTICNYRNIQPLNGPDMRSEGTFLFKTSKNYPYGLGMDGIKNITPINTDRLNEYHQIFKCPLYQ